MPGLNGFAGEFVILMAAFVDGITTYTSTGRLVQFAVPLMALSGVVLGAVYMLTMFKRMMFGPLDNPKNKVLKDLSPREIAVMLPLVLAMFYLGVRPGPLLNSVRPAAKNMLRRMDVERKPQRSGQSAALQQLHLDGKSLAQLDDVVTQTKEVAR